MSDIMNNIETNIITRHTQIDNAIDTLEQRINSLSSGGLTRQIVETLPAVANGDEAVIYMVGPKDDRTYDEYMFIAGVSKKYSQGIDASLVDHNMTVSPSLKTFSHNDKGQAVLENMTCTARVDRGSGYYGLTFTGADGAKISAPTTDINFYNFVALDSVYTFNIGHAGDTVLGFEVISDNSQYELIGNTAVDLSTKQDKIGAYTNNTLIPELDFRIAPNGSMRSYMHFGQSYAKLAYEPSSVAVTASDTTIQGHSTVAKLWSEGVQLSSYTSGTGKVIVDGVDTPRNDYHAANKSYVDTQLGDALKSVLSFEQANSLSSIASPKENTIYLVPAKDASTSNDFDEYIYLTKSSEYMNGDWDIYQLSSESTGITINGTLDTTHKFKVTHNVNPSDSTQYILIFTDAEVVTAGAPSINIPVVNRAQYTSDQLAAMDAIKTASVAASNKLWESGVYFKITITNVIGSAEKRYALKAYLDSQVFEKIGSTAPSTDAVSKAYVDGIATYYDEEYHKYIYLGTNNQPQTTLCFYNSTADISNIIDTTPAGISICSAGMTQIGTRNAGGSVDTAKALIDVGNMGVTGDAILTEPANQFCDSGIKLQAKRIAVSGVDGTTAIRIENVATPTGTNDAATKGYVDNKIIYGTEAPPADAPEGTLYLQYV